MKNFVLPLLALAAFASQASACGGHATYTQAAAYQTYHAPAAYGQYHGVTDYYVPTLAVKLVFEVPAATPAPPPQANVAPPPVPQPVAPQQQTAPQKKAKPPAEPEPPAAPAAKSSLLNFTAQAAGDYEFGVFDEPTDGETRLIGNYGAAAAGFARVPVARHRIRQRGFFRAPAAVYSPVAFGLDAPAYVPGAAFGVGACDAPAAAFGYGFAPMPVRSPFRVPRGIQASLSFGY